MKKIGNLCMSGWNWDMTQVLKKVAQG